MAEGVGAYSWLLIPRVISRRLQICSGPIFQACLRPLQRVVHPQKRAGVDLGRVTVGLRGPTGGHTNAAVSHKMERGREAAVSHKEERDRKAAGRAVEGKAARVAVRDREAAGILRRPSAVV